ncbi:MAG TPA: hypothetical protein VFJ82_27140 [Longimicrobium sp.]|nr:hypothetical protein [Longimicrobium sp.]
MIDPQQARETLREYYATASDDQVIEDLRRFSPELAERLGVAEGTVPSTASGNHGIRGFFASFGRSVHRLFS